MWIFISIFLVLMSLIICSRFYNIMFPGIRLISTEMVLIPLRFSKIKSFILILMVCFRIKIPDVTERLRRYTVGRTLASNLIYTIWAVFGGFILHFLLSNYLSVLLRPTYETPVETAEDIVKRDIIPFMSDGYEIYRQMFAASSDPNYQEISRRLIIANDWDEYNELVRKVNSTGLYADIQTFPAWFNSTDEWNYWYKSTETIAGDHPFTLHIKNKKWPLKKVRRTNAS